MRVFIAFHAVKIVLQGVLSAECCLEVRFLTEF